MHLKTHLQPLACLESIYTGGQVCHVRNTLFTASQGDIHICERVDGKDSVRRIETDDSVACFAVSPDFNYLVVCYSSLLIKIFSLADLALKRSFKAHIGPVLCVDFDPTSTLFCTGSADSTVKVWDVGKGHCTHNFKGHSGIISAVRFHPSKLMLASASDDCKVKTWDLKKSKCVATLDAHVSVVRSLQFTADGEYMFSAGRDQVFCKWQVSNWELILTVPIYESVEAMLLADYNGMTVVCTGGEKGIIRLWDIQDGSLIAEQDADVNVKHEIVLLVYATTNPVIVLRPMK